MPMHQRYGHGRDPVVAGLRQSGHDRRLVQRSHFDPFGVQSPGNFEHLFIKQVRPSDVQLEERRPRLRPDPEEVTEPFGDKKRDPFALPLEKRIGGDRRPHLHRRDRPVRDRLSGL